jgi:predicted AlkP superfamily phosphohydrolase/phosphomutase
LWHLLNAAGYSTGIMQVPLTYPPSPVNGWLITGMFTPEGAQFAYPPELGQQIRHSFPDYRVSLRPGFHASVASPAQLERELRTLTAAQLQVWEFLLDTRPADMYFVVFPLTDWAAHHLGTDAARQGQGDCGQRLQAVYRLADDVVGRCLSRLTSDDAVIIVSDHGSCPLRGVISINTWLLRNGYMHLRPGALRTAKAILTRMGKTRLGRRAAQWALGTSPRLRKSLHAGQGEATQRGQTAAGVAGLLTFADVDWNRTRAFCIGTYPAIWINKKGREPLGIVSDGREYEAVCRDIAAGLEALDEGPSGEKPVARVVQLRQNGSDDGRPDLLVETRGWAYTDERLLDPLPGPFVWPPAESPVAYHSADGILFAAGPCFRVARDEISASLSSIVPMVLRAFGIRPPAYMADEELADVLCNPLSGGREPVDLSPALAQQRPTPHSSGYSPRDAESVAQRLRQLGYL